MNTSTLFFLFVGFGACMLIVVISMAIVSRLHDRRTEKAFIEIYRKSQVMIQQITESLKVQSQTASHITAMYEMAVKSYSVGLEKLQSQRDELTKENRELARSVARLTDIVTAKKDQTINFNTTK